MKLLLVDDHPLYGVGFAHALGAAEPGMRVLNASSLEEGLALAAAHPDLDAVLVDYHLGALNGIEGLRRFGQQHPQVARMLISGDDTPSLMAAARAAGASGFLSKSQTLAEMRAALRVVADGGLAFGSLPRSALPEVQNGAAPQPTVRQLEVLALLAHGQPNKRIASMLGIAERTVKLHITALLTLMGARNRTQLVVVARERGLV
jgi:DNA-binding NarL/FixJ family response regulator